MSLPHSMPWHPRLSERLGLFRLAEAPGSHEALFTHPELLAKKIEDAGRDREALGAAAGRRASGATAIPCPPCPTREQVVGP